MLINPNNRLMSTENISAFDLEIGGGGEIISSSHFNSDIIEVPAVLPTVLYFRLDIRRVLSPARQSLLETHGKFTTIVCDGWDSFSACLAQHPSIIVIYWETILEEAGGVRKFFKMLDTLRQYSGNGKVPVAIVIDPTTSQEFVADVKHAGAFGIIPSDVTFSSDALLLAAPYLLSGREYWPAHIITNLPSIPKFPVNAYFRSDWATYITPQIAAAIGVTPWKTQPCATWNELSKILTDDLHQIVFHIDMITTHNTNIHEFISMIETLIKYTLPNKKIPIGVGIESTTPVAVIKELQKTSILGIVPSAQTFGGSETYKGLEALFNRVAYWPKHIISQLPGNIKKTTKSSGIHLTDRQREVMDLVCNRGLANKGVARMLKISESTVKIHLSAVMKAYGVRNRTQLALAVTSSLKV